MHFLQNEWENLPKFSWIKSGEFLSFTNEIHFGALKARAIMPHLSPEMLRDEMALDVVLQWRSFSGKLTSSTMNGHTPRCRENTTERTTDFPEFLETFSETFPKILFLDVHILLWMCYQKGLRLWVVACTIQLVAVPTLYHGVRRHSRWGYNSRGVQVRALNVFGWLLILFVSRTFGFKRTVSESFFGHETCNFNMYFTYMYN